MKHIAVLLTVFNRKENTMHCLRRLMDQKLPDGVEMHVYLTNDGCTDGTPETVREEFPQVVVINGDGTLFWNRGMWTAWEAASKEREHDWYLWLNDDTELMDNAVLKLITESERQPNGKHIIVGATKETDGQRLTYGGRINNVIQPCDGIVHKVDYFNGNIVLVTRMTFQTIGNLDHYFTHSKGDFDYGLRARKAGIELLQYGEALGICDIHKRIDKWCDPEIPFKTRWNLLHKPIGMPPNEIFHLERRHQGIVIASFHWTTIYIRCLFPMIWIALGKSKLTN